MILPRLARDHVPGDRLPNEKDAGDVGLQQFLPFVGWKILQRRTKLHAGIVDQYVDGADVLFHGVYGGGDGIAIRHVEERDRYFSAPCPQLFRGLLDPHGRAAIEDDAGAVGGQSLRDRVADALAGTGDQRTFSGEVEQFAR